MKKKELERIGKRLLPELPGFAVEGNLLFVQPIAHTLRAIYFDRSIDPRGFYAQVFVQPLFIPSKHIGFNFGWRLDRERLWNADAPGQLAELGSAIKREALPFLLALKSPRDVAEAAVSQQKSADPYIQQVIAYSYARAGDVSEAVRELDKLIDLLRPRGQYPSARERSERAEMLKGMLLTNPTEAQGQLEAWENETARNLGLDKFR